jgi:DNA (cytosine-5)-methyltransferase 1
MQPRLLDLFCGAGGAAVGYHRAGFEVVGVDIEPQPNYPFEFWKGDALKVLDIMRTGGGLQSAIYDRKWDAIHASPPCQKFTPAQVIRGRDHGDLLTPTRELLDQLDLPYAIENVGGAPLARQSDLFGVHGLELCGSMFGLPLRRHRLFEITFPVMQPACRHAQQTEVVGVYGHTGTKATGNTSGNHGYLAEDWRRAMGGIDWMNRDELAQAIPPAYTEYIGRYLIEAIERKDHHGRPHPRTLDYQTRT